MSKRAEQKALEAYPIHSVLIQPARRGGYYADTYFREGFINGYEQAESETIERACDWLFAHLPILVDYYNEDIHENADRSDFIKLFRKQMEEE